MKRNIILAVTLSAALLAGFVLLSRSSATPPAPVADSTLPVSPTTSLPLATTTTTAPTPSTTPVSPAPTPTTKPTVTTTKPQAPTTTTKPKVTTTTTKPTVSTVAPGMSPAEVMEALRPTVTKYHADLYIQGDSQTWRARYAALKAKWASYNIILDPADIDRLEVTISGTKFCLLVNPVVPVSEVIPC